MADKKDSRRQYLTLQAINPDDGTLTATVQISFDRMQTLGKRSMGHAKECCYNWRWEKADPDEPGLPIGHETRFRKRL